MATLLLIYQVFEEVKMLTSSKIRLIHLTQRCQNSRADLIETLKAYNLTEGIDPNDVDEIGVITGVNADVIGYIRTLKNSRIIIAS